MLTTPPAEAAIQPIEYHDDLPVGLAQGALGFLLAGLGPYLLLLAAELHQPSHRLAWLSSSFGAGLITVALISLVLPPPRPNAILRLGAAAVAFGAAVEAAVPSPFGAALGSLLVGLGGASIVVATAALIHGPGAAARFTRVTAISSLAGITAPLLVAAVAKTGLPGRLALLAPLPMLLVLLIRRPRTVSVRPTPTDPQIQPPIDIRPSTRGVVTGALRIVLAVSAEFCFVIWGAARLRDTGASSATAVALSTAFPIGMALGRLAATRLAAPEHLARIACLAALVGTGVVAAFQNPWLVAAGLGTAGVGIAILYPVNLARLTAVPGLATQRSASLSTLASGIAVLTAPAVLAVAGSVTNLRTGFLIPALLLAILFMLSPGSRKPSRWSTKWSI